MIYNKIEKYQQVFCYAYMKTLRPSEYIFKKNIITWNRIKKLLLNQKYDLLQDSSTACFRLSNTFYDNLLLVAKKEYTPVEYLMLPAEINNILRRNSIRFIEDLKVNDISKIRKLGNNYIGRIEQATNNMDISQIDNINKKILQYEQIELDDKTLEKWWNELLSENPSRIIDILLLLYR
ncbi:hypothetical protein OZZ17_08910 [[Ruminococcus] gnavus]|jgi:hypothetical protein|uniref:Uncharacterized protein n=1 Tax=Mediterraneibacter gnavus TaxID=33038 RepID=A0A9Q4HZI1_MEDGN|nr:hypothetical protein [Mediterraneibacter gnavus]MCZ0667666.1 hypothetical protein [Mediterraneibacter gnavus]